MKNKLYIVLAACLMLSLTGCDFFGIKPLDKVSGDQLAGTSGGIKSLLANVYSRIPMEDFVYSPTNGFNYRRSGEVTSTLNIAMYTDDAIQSNGNGIGPDNVSYWAWSDLRQVNIFMDDIEKAKAAGTITEGDAARYLGEAHFIRAYIYFGMAKRFGGLPIIKKTQDNEYIPGDPSSVSVPRSKEADTWKFILEELDAAAAVLPTSVSGDDLYRATKWSALALKSRAALHAASVAKYGASVAVSGPALDQGLVGMSSSDASYFYAECIKASKEIINNSGKTLYGGATTDKAAALKNYSDLFLTTPESEVLFAKAYLDGTIYSNTGHSWNQYYTLSQVRTSGSLNFGRFSVTLDLVDEFEDYSDDGQRESAPIVTRTDGNEEVVVNLRSANAIDLSKPYKTYDNLYAPFENKDVRLLASVIVPGSEYSGKTIIFQGGIVKPEGGYTIYENSSVVGKDGKTYYGLGGDQSTTSYSGYGVIGASEGANFPTSGFSVRKYMAASYPGGSDFSSTVPFIDLRLGEIYLNFAEAVVESNSTADNTLAAKCLNDLRHRAAHTDNIPLTLDNVLKERRVELAFEGQRYWDLMRRREWGNKFNGSVNAYRHILVPMLDLRGETPKYIFVRARHFYDENAGARTFQNVSYYKSIPGVATSGLVQNPGY